MELVSSGNVRREKQCNRLEQVVNVAKSNVYVQAVLLGAVLRREHVLFVGLWCGCRTRDLDQFGHFDGKRELALRLLYNEQIKYKTQQMRKASYFTNHCFGSFINLQRMGSPVKFLKRYLVMEARGSLTSSMIRLLEPK